MSTKTCSNCSLTKAVEDFQVRRASSDGRTASCRACLSQRDKARGMLPHRVQARAAYAKTEAGAEATARAKRKYANSDHGKTARRESIRQYRATNPEIRRAHTAVERAIKSGSMQQLPCEICGDKAHAHHPHYGAPLLVTWLCVAHHKQAHAETIEYEKLNTPQ